VGNSHKPSSGEPPASTSLAADSRPVTARINSFDPDNLVSPASFARERSADVLLLHEALASLEVMDPRCARLVQLRFYLGLTVAESAEAMGITPSTADDDWQAGKAWLARWLRQRGM
jgi:DNA-directed RNA polymerase specialized sigma24 family protein